MDPEPAAGDAFGAALNDYYERGIGRVHVIERDDGFIDNADTAQYFAPPADWPEIDRLALEHVTGRVLDIGAGAGRASLLLQEHGCDATALDVSPLAANVCAKRGVRSVFAGGIEDFVSTSPAPFDAFVLLGNNLGLLHDASYAPRFFDLLASIARPGAVIAGTCLDPYTTSDAEHLAYHERNRASGRMAGQIRMRVRYRGLATAWWDYLFMSPEELAHLVAGTRWRIEERHEAPPIYAARLRLA